MSRADKPVYTPKLVLLGDSSVGKSCLVVRLCRGEYYDYQEPTIGAAFLTKLIENDDATIRFEIWDTAGQERYRSLAPMYYRSAAAALIVFDVTSRDSFEGAQKWVKEIQRRGEPNAVIALAGNKADLKDGRVITAEEAEAYAAETGVLYMDTSAKTGLNVLALFDMIARKIPRSAPKAADSDILKDLQPTEPPKKSGGCCS